MARNLLKFGFLPRKQTAFFLCDLQEKFRPTISYFDEIVHNAARLVKLSKIFDIPLVVTEQYPSGLGHTIESLKIDHAVGIFPKNTFSMCTPEVIKEIENMEKFNNLSCVVLFGIATHACVEQTAIDLRGRNLFVHVVADASSCKSLEDRRLALQRMQQIGCFITTSESVILKLLGGRDNPLFKEVQLLFKTESPYTGLFG